MKYSRLSLAMIALLATQTVTQADDMDRDRGDKKPARTWRQAAYDNRYGLVAGSAAVGLGALGYVYGGDFMTWYNSLSSEDQTKAQDVLEKSVEKDLQVIEEKQEVVTEKIHAKKNSAAQQKAIAKEEQAIAQAQKQVAQKQTWLQWIGNAPQNYLNMRANDPVLQQIQADIDAKNAEYAAENPDYRSSDIANSDRVSDQEKAKYKKQNYKTQANQRFETYSSKLDTYDDEVFFPELEKAGNDQSRRYDLAKKRSKLENQLRNERFAPIEVTAAGPVNRVLGGDFSDVTNSEAYKNASVAGRNLVDRMDDGIKSGLNSAGQTASDAYNKVAAYFTPAPAAESPAKDTSSNLTGADVEGFSTLGDGDRDESL